MTKYAWIIDRDHIDNDADGLTGPWGADPMLLAKLAGGKGVPFRMYDDDGALYYDGRCVSEAEEFGGEEFLYPLDDFGEPNAGCTRIDYRHPITGAWETL